MRVTVFGTGYVGLVQAAVLANVGHDVYCVDIDEQKIENLKKGIIPIFEPGLKSIVEQNYREQRLHFTMDAKVGVEHGGVIFIAVGTPPDETGAADLQYVLTVAETIAQHMNSSKIVINKSTVPVGTADKVAEKISDVLDKRNISLSYDVVSNPEFLKEGAAVSDCMKPDRIIIGTNNPEVVKKMRELYSPFNRNHDRFMVMDTRSAELTKYAANSMLATKISFMNEMANIAERVGADIESVRQGIGSDPRIGYQFIYPGCGYGGSCFPKDVTALIQTAENYGYRSQILSSVDAVNLRQKQVLFDRLYQYFEGDLEGKVIAVWGLSFKPNTDDMRQAASRVLMESLWDSGARVQAYDPEAMNECQRIYGHRPDLLLMGTKEAVLNEADALVICTEWRVFQAPNLEVIRQALNHPVVVDGRNLYDPNIMKEYGFTYFGVGRGESVNR